MKTKKTDWDKLAARLKAGATPDVPRPELGIRLQIPKKNPPTEAPKRKFKVKFKSASDRCSIEAGRR